MKEFMTYDELLEIIKNLNVEGLFIKHRTKWKNMLLDDMDVVMNGDDCIKRLVKLQSVVMNLNNIFDIDLTNKRIVSEKRLKELKNVGIV